MVVCQSAKQEVDADSFSLTGLINELHLKADELFDFAVIVSLATWQNSPASSLSGSICVFGANGEQTPLRALVNPYVVLRNKGGIVIVGAECSVRFEQSGDYAFQLTDPSGYF